MNLRVCGPLCRRTRSKSNRFRQAGARAKIPSSGNDGVERHARKEKAARRGRFCRRHRCALAARVTGSVQAPAGAAARSTAPSRRCARGCACAPGRSRLACSTRSPCGLSRGASVKLLGHLRFVQHGLGSRWCAPSAAAVVAGGLRAFGLGHRSARVRAEEGPRMAARPRRASRRRLSRRLPAASSVGSRSGRSLAGSFVLLLGHPDGEHRPSGQVQCRGRTSSGMSDRSAHPCRTRPAAEPGRRMAAPRPHAPARIGGMPHRIRDTGARAHRLPKSQRVLLLVDFINALDFPGAEQLARAGAAKPPGRRRN